MPSLHYILYLNSITLTPCEVGRKHLNVGQPYPPTTEGFARFETLLQQWPPGSPVTILVDLPDEAHQLEALPFIRGKDRHNMLERRCRHLFGDTPFTLTRSLGRNPDGRRDERILFAALPRPALITPWLERIAQAAHALRGIVSVPFLTRHYLPADTSGPILLAHATPAGFRVSCFENGQPRFSRLTSLAPLAAVPGLPGNSWQEELRRSADYLFNQRILRREAPAPVLLIHSSALGLPRDADLSGLHPGLAIRIGPPTTISPSDNPLQGLLQLLADHPKQAQFAPRSMRAGYTRRILGQTAQLGAAAIFLACAGTTLHDLSTIHEFREQKESSLARSRALEAQARTLQRALRTPAHALAQLEADLVTLENLQQVPAGPENDLYRLAETLSDNPAIHLEALDWQRLPPINEKHPEAVASRSLEISIARAPHEMQVGIQPQPLLRLLHALREWPGTAIRLDNDAMASPQSAPLGGEPPPDSQASPDRSRIQVRWLPSR